MEITYPTIIEVGEDESVEKTDTFYPGTVIINDKGLYGDWLVEEFGDRSILKYPTKEYLNENLDDIMKSKPVIVLLDGQRDEISLVSSLFPCRYLELDMNLLLEALGLNLEMDSLWELSRTKPYYRMLYLVMRYSFNPSFMFSVNPKDSRFPYVDEIRKLDLPFTREYLDTGNVIGQVFSPVVLDLAYIDDKRKQSVKLETIMRETRICREAWRWLVDTGKIEEEWQYEFL
ncbi:MAG: hypothetical protein ACLFNB_03890 [Candidatus Woesearchaeota archaeon]